MEPHFVGEGLLPGVELLPPEGLVGRAEQREPTLKGLIIIFTTFQPFLHIFDLYTKQKLYRVLFQ